jgi:hypothetical protein
MLTALLVFVALVVTLYLANQLAERYLRKRAPRLGATSWDEATAEVAEAYFRAQSDIGALRRADVFAQLGCPAQCDDWDHGRLICTWRGQDRYLRIHTRDEDIDAVYLLDPAHSAYSDPALEVIWERPAAARPGERGAD